jgi:hypothetical protein
MIAKDDLAPASRAPTVEPFDSAKVRNSEAGRTRRESRKVTRGKARLLHHDPDHLARFGRPSTWTSRQRWPSHRARSPPSPTAEIGPPCVPATLATMLLNAGALRGPSGCAARRVHTVPRPSMRTSRPRLRTRPRAMTTIEPSGFRTVVRMALPHSISRVRRLIGLTSGWSLEARSQYPPNWRPITRE